MRVYSFNELTKLYIAYFEQNLSQNYNWCEQWRGYIGDFYDFNKGIL